MNLTNLLALLGSGLSATVLVLGCKGPTCASTDLDCFLDHLVLVEPTEGAKPMELVPIPRSTLPPTSSVPVCTMGTPCAGSCVDLASDRANCGACGVVCNLGATCFQGACACKSPCLSVSGQCADVTSDPQNCGACGVVCDAGKVCSGGACVSACGPGQSLCAQGCVDLLSDDQHCGTCDTVCPVAHACSAGACACFAMICMPPGTTGEPPSITNQPGPMNAGEGGELNLLELQFNDPNGCQPAFCGHLCAKQRCSSGFVCSRPKRDHQIQGVFRSYLGFLAEPADSSVTLDTGIVPVSAPGCPDDLLDQLAAGDITVDVGVEVKVAVTIEVSVTDPGGSGSTCSDAVATCNCSVEACADASGSCWYETTHGRFDCGDCSTCQGAASAVVASCCPVP